MPAVLSLLLIALGTFGIAHCARQVSRARRRRRTAELAADRAAEYGSVDYDAYRWN